MHWNLLIQILDHRRVPHKQQLPPSDFEPRYGSLEPPLLAYMAIINQLAASCIKY